MVLSSQAPRGNNSRSYMVSRRRKPKLLRWVLLVLIVAGGTAGWMMLTEDTPSETQAADGATQSDIVNSAANPVVESTQPAAAGASGGASGGVGLNTTISPTSNTSSNTTFPTNGTSTNPETDQVSSVPQVIEETLPPGTIDPNQLPAFDRGFILLEQGKSIEGRRLLSQVLFTDRDALDPIQRRMIRDRLNELNQSLVFSSNVVADDPLVVEHRVQSGDLLGRIARAVDTPYPFIEKINDVKAERIRVGQRLKLMRGPFHAQVIKHEFMMDLYLIDSETGMPTFVKSLPVGLGEHDSTPEGAWVVERGRKVKNPAWTNPRTGKHYPANDPANPIGEYWIALAGTDQNTMPLSGYGIHGTVEPESIGNMESMGCVRLLDDDIQLVFNMMVEGKSTVQILP